MRINSIAGAIVLASAGIMLAVPAQARDQIRIVGSSTVYPFTTTVAEQFGKSSGMKNSSGRIDRDRRWHEAVLCWCG